MTAAARDQQQVNGKTAPEGSGGQRPPRWDPGFDSSVSSEATQQVDPAPSESGQRLAAVPEPPASPSPAGGSGPVPQLRAEPPSGAVELSSAQLLRPVTRVPRSGWRAALYAATGGLINPGESASDELRRQLSERVNQRLIGCSRIAALSVKGGVGKSTTTAGLGSTFAALRGDRVIALDANPDRGNLVEKVPRETTATVRDLLADAEQIRSAGDVRAYTSQSAARLEVLASEADPAVSEAFNDRDYHAAVDLLSTYYNILLTDCGTGLSHSALGATLEVADNLLIITTASIDGVRAAGATIEWLQAHGYRELVARSVTVINRAGRQTGPVDLDAAERYFAAETSQVIRIPYDPHLDEGGEIHLEQLRPATRDAFLGLAAVVADDFARTSHLGGGARRRTPALLPGTDDHPARP